MLHYRNACLRPYIRA